MKQVEYLSPTSLKLWESSQEDFYLQYLSDHRPPRFPQNQAMSIGSSFDAYTKSYLHEVLFGKDFDPKYSLEALIEAQVEPQHRDWATQHGAYVFQQYKDSGALADLMLDLKQAQGDPRFEFEVKGAVHGYREPAQKTIDQVILLGKPDVYYINAMGCAVILDWKVNGYCSRSPWTPMAGYVRMRSAGKTAHGMHKSCQPMMINGVMCNVATFLENVQEDWARQLSIYAWLCGQSVGSKFVVAIDQIVCDATKGHLPSIRVAEHRLTVSSAFQDKVFRAAATCWEIIHSDHIFRGTDENPISQQDSQDRCAALDGIREALMGDGSTGDQWFAAACRG